MLTICEVGVYVANAGAMRMLSAKLRHSCKTAAGTVRLCPSACSGAALWGHLYGFLSAGWGGQFAFPFGETSAHGGDVVFGDAVGCEVPVLDPL